MKKLIREIHRRSLWQVIGIYLATSWVALQVVETLGDSVGFPAWVQPFALALLIIGFPVVLATAVVQEGVGSRPERSQTDPEFAASDAGTADAPPTGAAGPAPPAPDRAARPERGVHHRVFTWRNALAGGVLAFALLGLLTAGWLFMRAAGIGPAGTLVAKGVLEERDRILLADFANRTSDSLLAGVVTEAMRVDLAQSDVVRLAEPSTVTAALERMEQPTDAPLDARLARLVAQREGLKAVLTGDVGEAGSGYVLTAQLVAPADGEILISHRESASDPGGVINAIDRLSKHFRERMGESLRSIRAAPPLERVTTSNLEALRLYSQGVRAIEVEGDWDRGIALLDQAVVLDSAFAAAYRKIGVTLGNRFEQRDRRLRALTKAYEHRERLSQTERYMTIAAYHSDVTGDEEQATAAYESLLQFDPDYYPALNNLGIRYYAMRNPARAEELYLRAARADSSSPFPYLNAVWPMLDQGRIEDARGILASLDSLFPGYPFTLEYRGKLEHLEGDYGEAAARFSELRELRPADPYWRAETSRLLAAVSGTRGKLREFEEHMRDRMAANEARDLPEEILGDAISVAWTNLRTRGDTARALRSLEEALERRPLSGIAPADRPYLGLADFYAAVGEVDRARALIAEFEAAMPADRRGRGVENDWLRSRALVAVGEGRADEAIELIRRSDTGGCYICPMFYYAEAFERAGLRDSALAVYERYVDRLWVDRIYWDETELPRYLERLGQLYDEVGDLESAARYYARFVELWAEADEELQPRVEAAQARLEEIVRERG